MRILLYWLLTLTVWRDEPSTEHTGRIQRADLQGTVVRIYCPPGNGRFPVLYACDGQNCFQSGGPPERDWHLDETVDSLIRTHKIDPIFVVTLDHPLDRLDAYTSRRIWRKTREEGGGAEQYAQTLLVVKKIVDADFSTIPDDTAILGSSLGGLFALYAGYQHSFRRAAALSPSVWWMGRPGTGDLIHRDKLATGPERVWLDMGTEEDDPASTRELLEGTASLRDWLQSQAPAKAISFKSYPGAKHQESFWAARLPEVLQWLYPPAPADSPR